MEMQARVCGETGSLASSDGEGGSFGVPPSALPWLSTQGKQHFDCQHCLGSRATASRPKQVAVWSMRRGRGVSVFCRFPGPVQVCMPHFHLLPYRAASRGSHL
ncbi:rCG25627 [Rattus norvegicus]|uniref:RCG25627 n=1 Tax=Rattus norvegicus TaxID=10116 RepID=A6I447_RAT|nr:rCG25627 [Rattus norvegicus]